MPSTEISRRRIGASVLVVAAASATFASAGPANASEGPLTVDYHDCTEYIGFEWVGQDDVTALLPDGFAEDFGFGSFGPPPPDAAQIIVRTVHCDQVDVAGRDAGAVTLAQIGIVTALGDAENVDPTPFNGIDNYQLELITDSALLASRLNRAGVQATVTPNLSMTVEPAASGFVSVDIDADPRFTSSGIQADANPYPGFVADWWGEHGGELVRARQIIPEISFGFFGTMTMDAGPASVLHDIFGDDTVSYDVSLLGRFPEGPQVIEAATPGA